MAAAPATTVAIPLHRGLPWVDSVVGNITRLRGHARLIVSDVHEHDGALARVRERVDAGPDLTLVGRRDLAAGWVPHCNDLLARATTPLVMWLPQDDEIDAGWITRCEGALDAHPAAVLAHGVLVGLDAEGLHHRGEVIAPSGHLADPALAARLHAAGRFLVDSPGPLGIAFRGVFRREWACPLPAGEAGGEWGDLLWAVTMLLRGPFVEAPGAVYRKRYRPDGEHMWWTPTARPPGLVPAVLRAMVDAGPAGSLPAALAALWGGDREARIAALAWAEECAAVAARSLEETHRAAGEVYEVAVEAAQRTAALERRAGEEQVALVQARAALAQTRDALARAEGERDAAAAATEEARAALAAEREARARAERAAAEARAEHATLVASRSWRVTAPLRHLTGGLRRGRDRDAP